MASAEPVPIPDPRAAPAGRGPVRVPWVVIVTGVLVIAGVAWAYLVTRDLFVLTEARGYALYRPPVDLARFFLFPEIDFGNARLTGRFLHRLTGAVCGPSAACINGWTALLTGLCLGLLGLHTWQLLRRPLQVGYVLLTWLVSCALLATWIWQSTRFEIAALLGIVLTGSFWWWLFARPCLTRPAALLAVGASIVLMAAAFNAKEVAWVLLPVMPLLAVVRGAGIPGAVRRNLLLCVVPLAWGAWFVTWSLTHIVAAQTPVPIVQGAITLLRAGLGLGASFMYVEQEAPGSAPLEGLATIAYLIAAVLAGVALAWAGLAWWRDRASGGTPMSAVDRLAGWGGELYLAMVTAFVFVVSARATTNTSAYYLLVPIWSGTVLAVLVVRRAARRLPHPRAWLGAIGAAWLVGVLLAYAGQLGPGSTYRQVVTASTRMEEVGVTLRQLLADRPVGTVHWLNDFADRTGFLVLRDPAIGGLAGGRWASGGDLWPYLTGARADVVSVTEGTTADLRARLPELAGPGEVVVSLGPGYRLLLVAYEGVPLLEAPDAPAP